MRRLSEGDQPQWIRAISRTESRSLFIIDRDKINLSRLRNVVIRKRWRLLVLGRLYRPDKELSLLTAVLCHWRKPLRHPNGARDGRGVFSVFGWPA